MDWHGKRLEARRTFGRLFAVEQAKYEKALNQSCGGRHGKAGKNNNQEQVEFLLVVGNEKESFILNFGIQKKADAIKETRMRGR